jgi:heme-degrading monooxygenase HmoA
VHVRIATYELQPGRIDDGVRSFREAAERIRGLDGLTDVYFFVNRETGRAVTVTLWASAAAMAASRVRASSARSDASRAVDGGVVSVDEFELAFHLDGA